MNLNYTFAFYTAFLVVYTILKTLIMKGFTMNFFKKDNTSGPKYIIVGLGNPGNKYLNTRHNVGFIAIEKIAQKNGVSFDKLKYNSLIATCKIEDTPVLLMKPQTYMNNSGQSVVQAMNFYKIPPENVVIIFDDISLDVGKMRIRQKGSHGGQNGMKNIIALSGTDTFQRIKIGIGAKPNPHWDLADWVLSKFNDNELKTIEEMSDNANAAIKYIISDNTIKAMNLYN